MNQNHAKQRLRVKICGITRVEDMLACYQAGVDAIGLVFFADSPRAVDIEQAREIVKRMPPFMTSVGLFVDPQPDYVHSVLKAIPLDVLQFHGDERQQQCIAYDRPYIKAIRVRPGMDLAAKIAEYPDTMALLLDSYVAGVAGGTGTGFDWQLIPGGLAKPLILAGGLTAENVADAIHTVRPVAVDVSGGVEVGKGIKDKHKIHAFMQEVEHASSQQ